MIAVEPESSPVLAAASRARPRSRASAPASCRATTTRSVVDEIRHGERPRRLRDEGAPGARRRPARRHQRRRQRVRRGASSRASSGPGKNVVTVLCDTGERYFSLDEYFNDERSLASAKRRAGRRRRRARLARRARVLAQSGVASHRRWSTTTVVDATQPAPADAVRRARRRAAQGRGRRRALASRGCRPAHVRFELLHVTRVSCPDNALELVAGHDLVLEGADNFATKFLAADACAARAACRCVQAGAVRWAGWALGVAARTRARACAACSRTSRAASPRPAPIAGVLGPVVGVLGALQAALALRCCSAITRAAGVLCSYRRACAARCASAASRAARDCPLCSGRHHATLDHARYMQRLRSLSAHRTHASTEGDDTWPSPFAFPPRSAPSPAATTRSQVEGATVREVHRRPREEAPRPQGAPVRRQGRAPLREHLRQRRGHPLPRRPRHHGQGRRLDQHRARHRGRLSAAMRWPSRSDAQRYARQLLLAEIGEAGQERLLRGARAASARRGRQRARGRWRARYLARAGVRVESSGEPRRRRRSAARAACRHDARRRAARGRACARTRRRAALAGALRAVEAIKQSAVGRRARPQPWPRDFVSRRRIA